MRAIVRTEGYRWVLVNGEVIIDGDKETGAMASRLLRRPARQLDETGS